jgi:hypothetical protein
MLECLVSVIIYVILALIVMYVIELLVGQFLTLPPPIILLIRLLIGLLVLIAALDCIGFLHMGLPLRG